MRLTTPRFTRAAHIDTGVATARRGGPANFTWAEPHAGDAARADPRDAFVAGMRHHHLANTAYPIAHLETVKPYRIRRVADQAELRAALVGAYAELDELMLYAHVPFCHTRCQFCEYTVVDPRKGGRDTEAHARYFDALLGELALYKELLDLPNKRLGGFDVGGGTPAFVDAEHIARLLDGIAAAIHVPADAEFSIETTPKIAAAEPEKIRAYFSAGLRRISMGVQTTDFKTARELGRDDHGYLERAVENIRAAGFESFNIDLMYGFPLRRDGGDHWAATVEQTMALEPDHVTLYRMRYKGTRMAHLQDRVSLAQVNAQEARARALLAARGYLCWVGKNTYSRHHPPRRASGCSDYLKKRVVDALPYVGLGLGAQSFSHHTLTYNLGGVTKAMGQYLRSVELGRLPTQDVYHLAASGAMGKMCAVSMYFGGIDEGHFRHAFGVELADAFADETAFALGNGLMEWTREAPDATLARVPDDDAAPTTGARSPTSGPRRLQLTAEGKKYFAGVVSLFYAPAVQRHLLSLEGGEDDVAEAARAAHCADMEERTPLAGTGSVQCEADDWARREADGSITISIGGARSRRRPQRAAPQTQQRALSSVTPSPRKRAFSSAAPAAAEQPFDFGNILFGGPCNQRCPFCIGRHLNARLTMSNQRTRADALPGLEPFLARLRATKTRKVIFTGTSTDPQLYRDEAALQARVRAVLDGEGDGDDRVHLSVHTNGLLTLRKLAEFNRYDSCTLSLNSLDSVTFAKMHGVRAMPRVGALLEAATIPVKVSCVVNEHNWLEVVGARDSPYLARCAALGVRRVAIRRAHDPMDGGHGRVSLLEGALFAGRVPQRDFRGNAVFCIHGVEVTVWDFDETASRSLNLFPDGTISDEYLLAKASTDSTPAAAMAA